MNMIFRELKIYFSQTFLPPIYGTLVTNNIDFPTLLSISPPPSTLDFFFLTFLLDLFPVYNWKNLLNPRGYD